MSAGCQAKMSLFSERNSTSALSYLGYKFIPMAVVLEASPTTSSTGLVSMAALNAGAESEICFFDAGISESSTLLWISLNFAVEDNFREGCFINLAVPCLGKASGYGDDTVWSGYLEFVVDEAWLGHERVEYVAAEYDVVHSLEGDHLKGHALLAVIINVAKSYLKRNAPKGPSLPTRNYAMENGVGPP